MQVDATMATKWWKCKSPFLRPIATFVSLLRGITWDEWKRKSFGVRGSLIYRMSGWDQSVICSDASEPWIDNGRPTSIHPLSKVSQKYCWPHALHLASIEGCARLLWRESAPTFSANHRASTPGSLSKSAFLLAPLDSIPLDIQQFATSGSD